MKRIAWIAKNSVNHFSIKFLKYSAIISLGKYSLVFTDFRQFIPEKEDLRDKILELELKINSLEKELSLKNN